MKYDCMMRLLLLQLLYPRHPAPLHAAVGGRPGHRARPRPRHPRATGQQTCEPWFTMLLMLLVSKKCLLATELVVRVVPIWATFLMPPYWMTA